MFLFLDLLLPALGLIMESGMDLGLFRFQVLAPLALPMIIHLLKNTFNLEVSEDLLIQEQRKGQEVQVQDQEDPPVLHRLSTRGSVA